MNLAKLSLLATTVLAGTIASSAQASTVVTDPGFALDGIGATSIQIVLAKELNCLSGPAVSDPNNSPYTVGHPTYNSAGAAVPVSPAAYAGSGAAPKPLNCATTGAQSADSGYYVGVGSGSGRKAWYNFTGFSGGVVPTFAHAQFAFSDGALAPSDITSFNSGAQTHSVGNPIEIPLYTLPVAIAYNGQYGINAGGTALNFNVKSTYKNASGGLRLTRTEYCDIFNGVITNWNDASLKATNGNQSLQDLNDSTARWNADGVPIRLVGRADSSGTTDIFARHLAAVCTAIVPANKFQVHAGGLPYDGSINLSNLDTNTTYKGAYVAGNFANTTDDAAHMSLSGAYFNGTSIDSTDGSEATGKFLVADGSSKLAGAINLAPDKPSATLPSTLLNGKIGYIGTDFIAPTNGATLFAAALPVNNSATVFDMPNAKNAVAALTELPPQSTTGGVYLQTDTRTVLNPTTGNQEPVDRANPLHWTAVLYTAEVNGVAQPTLANPVKGYPITGTTQFLPYQCYATVAGRNAVNNLTAMVIGKATAEGFTPYDALSFTNSSATAPGITVQNGIAAMPTAWNVAIAATFLSKSATASNGYILGQLVQTFDSTRNGYYTSAGTGGHGLWIQSVIPTSQATLNSSTANGNCTPGVGA